MLPRHGLTAQSVPLWSQRKQQDRFAHHLKVANPAASVAETSPARCVSEREKGGYFAPAGSKGRSPWRFFGDFLIGEKVTRGGGAERPRIGECRGGFAPSHIVGRRDLRPCKIPRSAPSWRKKGEENSSPFGVRRGQRPRTISLCICPAFQRRSCPRWKP